MSIMKETIVDPLIYIGPGACRKCSSPLILAERDLSAMELNPDGSVRNIIETSVMCTALCPQCGEKYSMMRSNGVYKPASLAGLLFDKIDLKEELEIRMKGLEKKENPFI